ncbi:MAG: hypothetical protein GF347_05215 [Candidatus Moranbacteria bacterium]|nr:hypothetical protein [Candidatus Moranbacteria bacterium]
MKIKIVLLCGGPSPERSISLNSTRSILDNLDKKIFKISIIYFDLNKNPYQIDSSEIYSNTVSDFEFKIDQIGHKLSKNQLINYLKKFHIVWPIIHGKLGEDGEIQKELEKNKIKFIGSSSQSSKTTIDKHKTQKILKQNGFFTLGTKLLNKKNFIKKLKQVEPPFVLKPNDCGSSIGVTFVKDRQSKIKAAREVFQYSSKIVLENICTGKEFTLIIVENKKGEPTPLIPTEIQFIKNKDKFFDFRKKYLASYNVHFHTPPRFDQTTLKNIEKKAIQVYKLLKLNDIARFDGWVTREGKIWFSDINSIPGMEQNSFIFRQSALIGMNHRDFLQYLVFNSLVKNKILSRTELEKLIAKNQSLKPTKKKKKIGIIFGGSTAERQISLLSGTNVWVKLKSSSSYEPYPILMDQKHRYWYIPHFYCLHHTVEEIECLIQKINKPKLIKLKNRIKTIAADLQLNKKDVSEPLFIPRKYTLPQISKTFDFVFLGLHGGVGEDGTLQKKLTDLKTPFNGSKKQASEIGMDKYKTAEMINKAGLKKLKSLNKTLLNVSNITNYRKTFEHLKQTIKSKNIILKPKGDGCSAGVVKINNANELKIYLQHLKQNKKNLAPGLLKDHPNLIELPQEKCEQIIAEEFIFTDKVKIKGKKIVWKTIGHWIEISIGVLGTKKNLKALTPSQTIATGKVLSVEEKFQGGTGINFTPPPTEYVPKKDIAVIKTKIAQAAKILKISGYARIDCFWNIKNKQLIIIEANTLPAMTPSTIIYHQALKEKPPLNPLKFIEKIIQLGFKENN